MTIPIAIAQLRRALDRNPECTAGIIQRERVVYTEHGRLSADGDKELFCMVRRVENKSYWYGHVLKVHLAEPDADGCDTRWAALVVFSDAMIDGTDENDLFANVAFFLQEGWWEPCYAQEDGDVFALCNSFEEACAALKRMIDRYALRLRHPNPDRAETWDEITHGRADLRLADVYGFGSCGSGAMEPELQEAVR